MHGIHKINQYIQFKKLLLMINICFSEFSGILKTSHQPQHLKPSEKCADLSRCHLVRIDPVLMSHIASVRATHWH